eukprot:364003-Chlamydomonas_euryale.AAC.17
MPTSMQASGRAGRHAILLRKNATLHPLCIQPAFAERSYRPRHRQGELLAAAWRHNRQFSGSSQDHRQSGRERVSFSSLRAGNACAVEHGAGCAAACTGLPVMYMAAPGRPARGRCVAPAAAVRQLPMGTS